MTPPRHRRQGGHLDLATWLALGPATVVLVLVTGGAALGVWGADGAGSGEAGTTTTADVTLSPGTPTADLYPGGTAGVVLVVANPNTFSVTIESLALDGSQGDGGFAVDAAHSGCAVSTLRFTTQTNVGAGWVVPGRLAGVDGTRSVALPGSLAMDPDASNACQDVTITVYLTAAS